MLAVGASLWLPTYAQGVARVGGKWQALGFLGGAPDRFPRKMGKEPEGGVAASHPMPCLAKLELGSLGLSLGGSFPSMACEPSRC